MSVRTAAEIAAVMDKVEPRADKADAVADAIYDTLRWVAGENPDDPYSQYLDD
ncbi:hypothetical protein [Nocardia brasiliensis]|uniref:hypothetical protein n=1 Tax=Nocardia brasiliensis TaxID=37326 RepID=UPI0024570777|nr:hypothetical protein [Nocardia brasiliensis]